MSARTTGSEDQPGGFFYPFWPLKKGNKKFGYAEHVSPKRTTHRRVAVNKAARRSIGVNPIHLYSKSGLFYFRFLNHDQSRLA